jgi:hypothetical protein
MGFNLTTAKGKNADGPMGLSISLLISERHKAD